MIFLKVVRPTHDELPSKHDKLIILLLERF
jgi:hypothetical protein